MSAERPGKLVDRAVMGVMAAAVVGGGVLLFRTDLIFNEEDTSNYKITRQGPNSLKVEFDENGNFASRGDGIDEIAQNCIVKAFSPVIDGSITVAVDDPSCVDTSTQ